jgi:hypothetical protein
MLDYSLPNLHDVQSYSEKYSDLQTLHISDSQCPSRHAEAGPIQGLVCLAQRGDEFLPQAYVMMNQVLRNEWDT